MNLIQCFQTHSTWYKGSRRNGKPVGVLWHDTAAGNPNIHRYVQPHETDADYNEMIKLLGKNKYSNDWNHIEHEAGLNAWIGKLADGSIATVQAGEFDIHAWGCGGGSKGSCNGYIKTADGKTKWIDDFWIQFEICDDGYKDKDYFEKVYKEACEFTAYICKKYNIDPKGTVQFNGVTVPTIICHGDSYNYKLGCNHSDVYPWFNKYGRTMDDVRNDVAKLVGNTTSNATEKTPVTQPVNYSVFKKGTVVQIQNGATYYSGKAVPAWVIAKRWVVYETATSNRVVINASEDGVSAIMSPIDAKYLTVVSAKQNDNNVVEQQAKTGNAKDANAEKASFEFGILDVVKIKDGVNTFYNGVKMQSWVMTAKLYVREVKDNGTVVVSTLQTGDVTGTVNSKDLVLIEKAQMAETEAPKEQKNEQKDGAGTETPKTQTNIIVEPPADNSSENSENTPNGNDAIHDEPLVEELSDETYIHSPEEAQNFIVRLLNHIISFIMKLFKK